MRIYCAHPLSAILPGQLECLSQFLRGVLYAEPVLLAPDEPFRRGQIPLLLPVRSPFSCAHLPAHGARVGAACLETFDGLPYCQLEPRLCDDNVGIDLARPSAAAAGGASCCRIVLGVLAELFGPVYGA